MTPVAAFVAIFALLLQLAVPPGFMVAATDSGPAVVICTGHGPLMAPGSDHRLPGQPHPSKSSGTCPFAGHGGAPLAPALAGLSRVAAGFSPVQGDARSDPWPWRRLAAPPPPSQASPQLLI